VIRVDSVQLREIRLPLKEALVSAAAAVADRRIILVELRTTEGESAWGECVALEAPTYTSETVDTAWMVLRRWLVPALLGASWEKPEEVASLLEGTLRGHPMARAALEMPCWQLAAGSQGLSLVERLGGTRKTVETGIALGFSEDQQAQAQKARKAAQEGYRRIRLKIAPGRDEEPVRTVLNALGGLTHPLEIPLAVDANGSYRLEDLPLLKRLDGAGLQLIEQPLSPKDFLGHRALQEELITPVCLDESIHHPEDVRLMLELGAARAMNLKPGRVGGLTASLKIHDLCQEAGVPIFVGGMLETGIGRAYNVALASLPGCTLPGDLSPSAHYWRRDLVEPEWTMEDGLVTVPWGRPGLGVEVDVQRIETLTVRRETMSL